MAVTSYNALEVLMLQTLIPDPSMVLAKLQKQQQQPKQPINRLLEYKRNIPLPLAQAIQDTKKQNAI